MYSSILLLQLHNEIRQANHLEPLRYSTKLETAAKVRVKESITDWSHSRYHIMPWHTAYNDGGFTSLGENLARNFKSEREAMKLLMNSPTHKSNIINPKFDSIGISCIKKNCAFWYGDRE